MQGLLELAGVPYVGAGVAASALCMDKDLFKAVLRDRGIPVARNVTLREGDEPARDFDYPVFVKPARLGSSVGISKVPRRRASSQAAVELARRHDDKVLDRGGRRGRRGRVRSPRQPRPDRVGRSARSSPTPTGTTTRRSTTRAAWSSSSRRASRAASRAACAALAVESFVATECEGMARIDFFVRIRRRGRRERDQHDPRLHVDERLREALRGRRDLRTPSSSTASSRSHSSATSAGAASSTRTLRADVRSAPGASRAEARGSARPPVRAARRRRERRRARAARTAPRRASARPAPGRRRSISSMRPKRREDVERAAKSADAPHDRALDGTSTSASAASGRSRSRAIRSLGPLRYESKPSPAIRNRRARARSHATRRPGDDAPRPQQRDRVGS